jgi:phosphatidylinositol glycan class V
MTERGNHRNDRDTINTIQTRDAMMVPWNAMRLVQNAPVASLLIVFTAWKSLLLTLAIVSPGPGYDTSTQLLFRGYGVNSTLPSTTSAAGLLAQKLTRWDAIYFASTAERGYQLEQEWAFGWGFSGGIAFLAKRKSFLASTKL